MVNIVVDRAGNLLLPDLSSGAIKKFSPAGTLLQTIVRLSQAGGVALDSTGCLLVSDPQKGTITKFSSSGKQILEMGAPGWAAGQLNMPNALAVDSRNNVFVIDQGNKRVQKFSPEGKHLITFDGRTRWAKAIDGIMGIAVDPTDNLYIADKGSIHKYRSEGAYLLTWTTPTFPTSLAFDGTGGMLVVGCLNGRLYRYAPDGKLLDETWCVGPLPGRSEKIGYEAIPSALAVGKNQDIFVLDLMNFRVLVFRQ